MRIRARIVLLSLLAHSAVAHGSAQQRPAPPNEKFGTVHFGTSCRPVTAPGFDRAVSLLHSFEFGASIQAFNDVIAVRRNTL